MKRAGPVFCALILALALSWQAFPSPEAQATTAQTTRDNKGVWFITAGNLRDAFDAMGYAVATDRLWQTELYFRSATGRLAELFGASELPVDMFMRTIGYSPKELKQGFKKLSKDGQTAVSAYIAGFNRRVDEVNANPALMPFQYLALSRQLGTTVRPQHWSVYDVLAWMALMQREFDPEALSTGQLDNAALLATLQQTFPNDALSMFQDLRWLNDPSALTYIPPPQGAAERSPDPVALTSRLRAQAEELPDLRASALSVHDTIQGVLDGLKKINAYVHMGSYAWTVAGSKTADGNPIIYSGPQMGFSVPSIVLEGSIEAPGYDVSGMTVPGVPGIIIGRTPHHAWSMQVGHCHTLDYFVEDPRNVTFWRKTVIHVAGNADVTLRLYRSKHGPVISPMPYVPKISSGPIITWDYAERGYELQTLDGFLQLARAQSMDDFGKGIEEVAVSQHFCYADRDGNIAYWMSGRDPVRASNVDPRLPVPGDGKHDWPKPVRLKPRSTDRNTAQGFYAGWNNKSNVNYDNAPNDIGYGFGPFDRAHVIYDYLSTHNNLTFEEVRDLALNIATTTTDFDVPGGVPWKFVAPYFTAAVEAYPTPARTAALQMLQNWDGHFVAGGPTQWAMGTTRADAWVLEKAWIDQMLQLTFADKLGTAGAAPSMQLFNVLLHSLEGSSSGIVNTYNWFQDTSGQGLPTDPQQLIVLALDQALNQLGPGPWNQPRGTINFTDDFLGLIHQAPYSNRSTYAHCVEFDSTGPIRIESMFPLGESGFIGLDASGNPSFDPNFFSMAPVYDPFTPRSFPLFQ